MIIWTCPLCDETTGREVHWCEKRPRRRRASLLLTLLALVLSACTAQAQESGASRGPCHGVGPSHPCDWTEETPSGQITLHQQQCFDVVECPALPSTLGDALHLWPAGSCAVWDQIGIVTGYRPWIECYDASSRTTTDFVLTGPEWKASGGVREVFWLDSQNRLHFAPGVTRETIARAFIAFAREHCR